MCISSIILPTNVIFGRVRVSFGISDSEEFFGVSGGRFCHFFEGHFQKIIVVIILLISYIQLRYEYEDHIIAIARLKNERNDVRYTSIEKWGDLTLRNRPEVIKQKVADSDVNLIESDEPAVIIK